MSNESKKSKSIHRRWRESALSGALLVSAGMIAGCSGEDVSVDELPMTGENVGQVAEPATLEDLALRYLGEDGKAIFDLGKDIAEAYSGVGTAIQVYKTLSTLIGGGENTPFEQVMQEQLTLIQARLDSILRAITDSNWLEAERSASYIYSEAMWASGFARQWVVDHGDTPLGLDTPGGVQVDEASWVATHTFMNDSWYWFPSGSGRRFDHRLALPRLVNSIAARLGVLLVTRPKFVATGEAGYELLDYRDRLGEILDEIDQRVLNCYSPGGSPPPPGSDPSTFVVRVCRDRLHGTELKSTIGSPRTDLSMRTELLKGLGLDGVRALRDTLYFLVHSAPDFTTRCAREGGTCSLSGVQSVAYGAAGGYFYRNAKSSISCSNDVFSDPKPSHRKQCYLGSLVWTPCVGESEVCYFPGVKMVRYGSNGATVQKLMATGSVACGNAEFGDPSPGKVKVCDYADPTWTRCADENGTCSVSGGRYVRFGWGSSWKYRPVNGSVACNSSAFGSDPAPGLVKVCEYASAF
jgi:hypothetical protein